MYYKNLSKKDYDRLQREKINEVYQNLADQMIEIIQSTNKSPWDSGILKINTIPRNGESGRVYKSLINLLVLMIEKENKNFNDCRWLPLNSIIKNHLIIKKGEKGTFIISTFNKKELKKVYEDDGSLKKDEDGNPVYKTFYNYGGTKALKMFNLDQLKLEESQKKLFIEVPQSNKEIINLSNSLEKHFIKHPVCEIKHSNKFKIPHYDIDTDQVCIPEKTSFKSLSSYLSVIAHELSHATGIKSRLNRDCLINYFEVEKDEDNKDYYINRAKEELIAEMSSVYILASFGIVDKKENSGKYLKSWLKELKEKGPSFLKEINKEVVSASTFVLKSK